MISWTLLYYISEWVIRLVMVAVVTRRRHPAAAMAWLLVIFFLPWVGLVLYLLVGENYLHGRRIKKHARLLTELKALGERFVDHPHIAHPRLSPSSSVTVALAQSLSGMPILGGNEVHFVAQTHEVIDQLIADIDAAQHHVHLLFYVYADDESGQCVADTLARAVQRGVTCRVLVDGVGSASMLKTLRPGMIEQGIEVQAALPVGLFRRRVARLDLRNHRKLAVIDGRIAYSGSQNIVNADYGRKDLIWRELMVRLTGPVVLELQAVFTGDWYFETDEWLNGPAFFPEPQETGSVAAQVLPSGPNYPTANFQRLVVAALHTAQKQVSMTTPYFIPDEPFLQAMQVAVLRGVDVDLIVPRRSDHVLVGAAGRAYYEGLLQAGVNLYLFTDGLLHAKTMRIDNHIALIGSSNFDIRSFALNFEINLLLYGEQVTEALRVRHEGYKERSERLTLDRWVQRSTTQVIIQDVAKLFSPLL